MTASSTSTKAIPETKVILATTDEHIDCCYEIRVAVFVDEQKYPRETEIDDRDPHCVHLLLYAKVPLEVGLANAQPNLGFQPVGTVRYDPKLGKLGRLAVNKAGRGFGYGKLLVRALHEYAVELAALKGKFAWEKPESVKVKAGSQVHAIPFYAKSGYKPVGERYLDEGEPHQMMEVYLPVP